MIKGKGIVESKHKLTKDEKLLMEITEAFGLTPADFEMGKPIYTKWGDEKNYIDLANLGKTSLKISKNIGPVYIDKIRTDEYVVVGEGTILHCDDIKAGKGVVKDFKGYLM